MMELRALEAEFRARMHKALALDGLDDAVRLSVPVYPDDIYEISLFAWVKPRKVTPGVNAVIYEDRRFVLGYRDRCIYVVIGNGIDDRWQLWNSYSFPDLSIPAGKFHFIGWTWDGSKIKVYGNGEVIAEHNFVAPIYPIGYSGTRCSFIGVWGDWNIGRYSYSVDGLIGSAYLYNCTLSESEVRHLYYNPFDPPRMEHLDLWLTPAGIDIANGKWWDLSGRNNHGTIYGCNEVLLTEPEVVVL